MGRTLSDREEAIQRGVIRLEYPKDKDDWSYTRKLCMNSAAFSVGDVVPFWDGDRVRNALVIGLFPEYSDRRDEWIMRYRVRVLRFSDGEWGNQWHYINPGQIDRAFAKEKDDQK